MGLLDNLFSDDPQKQAQLAMALGLLSGSGHSNKNFGADLGNAGQQGLLTYGAARNQQSRLALEQQAQQMHQMQLAQMRAANDEQGRIQALGPQFMRPGQPQFQPNDQETPSVPGQPQMDWHGYAQGLTGIDPQKGLALQAQLAQMQAKERVKVAPGETIGTYGPAGFKADYSAPDKPHFVDAGDSVIPVNPQTGLPIGPPIKKNMSPDAKATDARSRAAQKLADDHFQAGGNQYDSERGVMVNTRTGTAAPVQTASGALPAKVPDSIKKEIASLNSEETIIDGAIKSVKANKSAFSMSRGAATLAGTIPESVAGRMDTSQERQSRAFLFNTVSKVINERAGAAQSAQELARLRSFLPGETDNAEQVIDKMTAYKSYIKEKRDGFAVGKPEEPKKVRTYNPATGKIE